MGKHPVKVARRTMRSGERGAIELEPASAGASPFFSFRYASAEISLRGGKAQIRAQRAQWEDGKLSTESFDGELDRMVYERAVLQAQRHFTAQAALLFQSLGAFLPFSGKPPRDRG
jgi:hypothetical protein